MSTSDITDLMAKFREKKGIDSTLKKNEEIKEMTNKAKAVDAETDVQRRIRLRREREEREKKEKEESSKKSSTKVETTSESAESAEAAREARRLERQRKREEERKKQEEQERQMQAEREARRKKREEEARIRQEQEEAERQKRREERRKRLEEERKEIGNISVTERTERNAQRLKQAELIQTKETKKKEEGEETKPKAKEGETTTAETVEEDVAPSKYKLQIIELKTNNAALQKKVDELTMENEQFKKGANNRQIELENKIKENTKEIELLKGDLELYRGKQKEKPLFHTRPARDLEWPDELKMPVLKVGVKALGITSSNEAYIGEIKGDDGKKWEFDEVSVLKHKVFPAPEIMQETIDSLVMVNNNYKIRQQELEKEHKRYQEGVEREMRQLREDYEKMRDVYGADVVKMHANINNRVAMAYGLECNMAVQVAEAIKDVKDYSKGKSRWYCTQSKNDEKLWADLRQENNGAINFPKGRHDFKARLFQFYTSEDNELLCNELRTFKQEDLSRGKAFILDTFSEVFVYCGTGCPTEDRAKVTSAALAYNKFSDDGRSVNTPVIQVENGNEPVRFRLQFRNWDQKRILDKETQTTVFTDHEKFFSYSQLLDEEKLPVWVDRACLEEYLRDEEFKGVFKMDRSEFNLLPRWRKDAERRKAKLF